MPKMRGLIAVMLGWAAAGCFDEGGSAHPCDDCLECEECVEGQAGPYCAAVSNAYQQCVDDDVHWFDSCDADEGLAVECPEHSECVEGSSATAECACTNHWQGEDCDDCPGNWDPEADCAACLNNWQGEDCEDCPGNWDPEADCDDCDGNFDPALNCEDCAVPWIGDECDVCVLRVDLGSTAGSPSGLTWSQAFPDLQDAIDAAGAALGQDPGDQFCELWVAAGTYYTYESSTEWGIWLEPGVRLYGGFTGDEESLEERDWETNQTAIDGHQYADSANQVDHAIVAAEDAVVDGFTVSGGNADDEDNPNGGGLYIQGATVTVANCTFTGNSADSRGGAVFANDAEAELSDCTFTENAANIGGALALSLGSYGVNGCTFTGNQASNSAGAVYAFQEAEVVYSGCDFTDNAADFGGAGRNAASSTFEGCTFLGNAAAVHGGALRNSADSSLAVESSAFVSNSAVEEGGAISSDEDATTEVRASWFEGGTAAFGGAISNFRGTVEVESSVFHDNQVTSDGGAIEHYWAVGGATVSCTFYGNSADNAGGAVNHYEEAVPVVNCIAWGNPSPGPDVVYYECSSLVGYSDVEGGADGVGNIEVDPAFVDAAGDDFHLQPGSPCIDAADGSEAPDSDYDGNPVVDDPDASNTGDGPPWADMGAFERQPG